MSIEETVKRELTAAMKAKDVPRTSALRLIRAALVEESKKTGQAVSDEQALGVLRRLRKQRDESAEAYEQADRADLAELERAEATVIDAFLPQLADEGTTLIWVREAIATSGASSARELGRAMGALMKAHRGELDAKLARQLLERELTD
jgi:uncharacterized protein YqeY